MNLTTLRTTLVWGLALSLLVLLPSCDSLRPDLEVENENEPSRSEVLGTPQDVEGIASGLWRGYWGAYQWYGYGQMLSTMSDTYSCNWANFAMNRMSSEPRVQWNNSSAYSYAYSTETPWFSGYSVISNTADILNAISDLGEGEFEAAGIDDTRLKAYSNFIMGLVYGKLAASFDRAFLVDETTPLEDVARGEVELELAQYPAVTDFAIEKLNKAQEFAQQGHSPIPDTWIWGNTITDQQLILLANSYKARTAVTTARSTDERSSLSHVGASWSDVKTWVENGIESTGYSGQFSAQTIEYSCRDINCPGQYDIPNSRSKTTPAGFAPISQEGFGTDGLDVNKWAATQSNTWARADYRMIGPADVSNDADDCQGGFSGDDGKNSCPKEYINTLEGGNWSNSMAPFVTETPDRRISGPDGPRDHGKYFDFVGTALDAFPPARGSYHYSDRTYVRYQYHPEDGGPSGPMYVLTKPEMDLYKAEAILNDNSLGTMEEVADLINNTRVEQGELPPAEASTPVGSIEDPPNPLPGWPTETPTLWSMLKYEFHIETMVSSHGLNFFTRRAWGQLVEGTPLHLPIPARELNTLQKQLYTFGGVGGRCSAGNPTNCFGGGGGGSSGSKSLSGIDVNQLQSVLGQIPGTRIESPGGVR